MKRVLLVILAAAFVSLAPRAQAAVTPENFRLETLGDFTALCGVRPEDPNAMAAIHMCHGFVVGVSQFHQLFDRALEGSVYCIEEDERPSRDAAIDMLVAWSKAHPEYDSEAPIEGVLRWASERFPCEE